jgi:hypothetical protein
MATDEKQEKRRRPKRRVEEIAKNAQRISAALSVRIFVGCESFGCENFEAPAFMIYAK